MSMTLERIKDSMKRLNHRRAVLDDEIAEVNFLFTTLDDLVEAVKDGKVQIVP